MNIGITFGGYCPLHQGHMDLIMKAKKQNDHTYVFVAGYEDDRGGNLLPLKKRYEIIKPFLEDELTTVKYINDTELGLDESMSQENWIIWLNFLICGIGKWEETDTITFYVGEADYKEKIEYWAWVRGYQNVKVDLADRSKHIISGTECRQDPIHHWFEMMAPFRSYYSHNILIAGTASEGKTILVNDLAKYFGLPYSYEKGRDLCKYKTDREFNFKDFMYNLYEQRKLNEELIASPQNPGIFISDSDNITTLMYAHAYSEREGFGINPAEYKVLKDVAREYAKTTKWNKIFLLAPHEKPIVDDGERYMPDSDYGIRCKFFEDMKSLFDEFGYEYEVLDGNYYENWSKVKEYIEEVKA